MTWKEIKEAIETLGVVEEDKIAWITIITNDPNAPIKTVDIKATLNSYNEWEIDCD